MVLYALFDRSCHLLDAIYDYVAILTKGCVLEIPIISRIFELTSGCLNTNSTP